MGKRSDQRLGHQTKAQKEAVLRVPGAAPAPPLLGLEGCHPLAVSLYEALAQSPESRFFTPAVWQRARVNVLMLSKVLLSSRPSSQMYAAVQADWKSLLVDPAEQRRLGIEVQAAEVDEDAESASATVTNLRARLGG
ncbi:MAG: hypothetical protein ACR2GG_10680 [Gemmatimonadaceae bacterium]